MDVFISDDLQRIYKASHKNYDMAIMALLDSFDPNVFQPAFDIISSFSLTGDKTQISLGNAAVGQIKSTFSGNDITNDLINTLLWIAVLFPEI